MKYSKVELFNKDNVSIFYDFITKSLYKKVVKTDNYILKSKKWLASYSVSSFAIAMISLVLTRWYQSIAFPTLNVGIFLLILVITIILAIKINTYMLTHIQFIYGEGEFDFQPITSDNTAIIPEASKLVTMLQNMFLIFLLLTTICLYLYFTYSLLVLLIASSLSAILSFIILKFGEIRKRRRAIDELKQA